MYYTYLLENKDKKWYIGYTPNNPFTRLIGHNKGEVSSTKAYKPCKLVYFKAYINREDATGREKFFKKWIGKKFSEKTIKKLSQTKWFTA